MIGSVDLDPDGRSEALAMPTFTKLPRFARDFAQLPEKNQERFREAVAKFIEDLERGESFRPGLGVRRVQGAPGVFEMRWAPDGRATFHYGDPIREGHVHVVWRRVGTHSIFNEP
jgi:hypothetical protein